MTKTAKAYWCASGLLYALAGVMLWPTLDYAALSLDDSSLLREFASAPLGSVLGPDHFGHLRPGKNLFFWLLAHNPDQLPWFRAALLAAALLTAMLVQRLGLMLAMGGIGALSAAACWLLNPTTASTVAWLSSSNYVLALLFTLGYVALAAGRCPSSQQTRGAARVDRLRDAGASVCLLSACMQHELALAAPLVLILPELAHARDRQWRRDSARLAWSALPALCTVAALHVAARSVDVAYRTAHTKADLVFSSARYALANLRMWIWQPGSFGVLLHDEPEHNVLHNTLSWLSVILLGTLSARAWRSDKTSCFALSWIGAFLLPVINLVPLGNTPVAVQYLYMPGVGLALLLSRSAERLAQRLAHPRRAWLSRAPAIFLVLLSLAWLPEYRSSVEAWGDSQQLYKATLQNHPRNVEARANLVASYLERDQLREADALLVESLRIAPDDRALIGNRFELLWREERATEALSFLDSHDSLSGSEYQYRRARLLEGLGRWQEALPIYAAVSEEGSSPELRFSAGYQRATLLVSAGQKRQARQVIEAMLVAFPEHPQLVLTRELMLREEIEPE